MRFFIDEWILYKYYLGIPVIRSYKRKTQQGIAKINISVFFCVKYSIRIWFAIIFDLSSFKSNKFICPTPFIKRKKGKNHTQKIPLTKSKMLFVAST